MKLWIFLWLSIISIVCSAQNQQAIANSDDKVITYTIDFNSITKKHSLLVPDGCKQNVEGKLVVGIPINTCNGAGELKVKQSSGSEDCDVAYLYYLTQVCKIWNEENFKPSGEPCGDNEFDYTVKFTKK